VKKYVVFFLIVGLFFACGNVMAEEPVGTKVDARIRVLDMRLTEIVYLMASNTASVTERVVVDFDAEIVNIKSSEAPQASLGSPMGEYDRKMAVNYINRNAKQITFHLVLPFDKVKELTKLALSGNCQGKVMMDATFRCTEVRHESAEMAQYYQFNLINYMNLSIPQKADK